MESTIYYSRETAKMITNRHTKSTSLLALLSSRSIAPVDGGVDEADVVVVGDGGAIKIDGLPNKDGAECVPRHNDRPLLRERNIKRLEHKLDVGILSSSKWEVSCPGSRDICKLDTTSSLGGRCIIASSTSHRRMQSDEQLFQECTTRCPNSKLCDCFYTGDTTFDDECSLSDVAYACSNKEHLTCMRGDYATLMDASYCPIYECMGGYEGVEDLLSKVEAEQTLGLYYTYNMVSLSAIMGTCTYCVGYKSLCEFCKDNDSFMTESTKCFETNEVCKNALIEGTYPYGEECGFSTATDTTVMATTATGITTVTTMATVEAPVSGMGAPSPAPMGAMGAPSLKNAGETPPTPSTVTTELPPSLDLISTPPTNNGADAPTSG